ncbi:extensin [Iris pallida]|uniref:Extensin n=1 Tax=Iris pallida TaxID=29817 RepID=A0AAX6EVD6_IRIPA|nr:extensin [Iris pallida]KAJ6808060.1 extensin [Iris pallida]
MEEGIFTRAWRWTGTSVARGYLDRRARIESRRARGSLRLHRWGHVTNDGLRCGVRVSRWHGARGGPPRGGHGRRLMPWPRCSPALGRSGGGKRWFGVFLLGGR